MNFIVNLNIYIYFDKIVRQFIQHKLKILINFMSVSRTEKVIPLINLYS